MTRRNVWSERLTTTTTAKTTTTAILPINRKPSGHVRNKSQIASHRHGERTKGILPWGLEILCIRFHSGHRFGLFLRPGNDKTAGRVLEIHRVPGEPEHKRSAKDPETCEREGGRTGTAHGVSTPIARTPACRGSIIIRQRLRWWRGFFRPFGTTEILVEAVVWRWWKFRKTTRIVGNVSLIYFNGWCQCLYIIFADALLY